MARVSVILPAVREDPSVAPRISPVREALAAAGYGDAEFVIASEEGAAEALRDGEADAADVRRLVLSDPGRSAVATAALERGTGELLVVLDPTRGYRPEDVVRVVKALDEGRGEIVVGSRRVTEVGGIVRGPKNRLAAVVGRKAMATSDPLTGLIGVTRRALFAPRTPFQAVGDWFAVEILTKVQATPYDVPCPTRVESRPIRLSFQDVRHAKRWADHRYGNLSRLVQFCFVGASGMMIDLSFYAAFQAIFARTALAGIRAPILGPLDLAVSAFLAVAIALSWNFSLNRRLTFSYARHGSILRQFLTYVLSNALAVSLNLSLRLGLPRMFDFFDRHRLAAAVVGVVMATGLSFGLSRWVVFRHGRAAPEPTVVR